MVKISMGFWTNKQNPFLGRGGVSKEEDVEKGCQYNYNEPQGNSLISTSRCFRHFHSQISQPARNVINMVHCLCFPQFHSSLVTQAHKIKKYIQTYK